MKRILVWVILMCCSGCLAYHMSQKKLGVAIETTKVAAEEAEESLVMGAKSVREQVSKDAAEIDFTVLIQSMRTTWDKIQVIKILMTAVDGITDPKGEARAIPTTPEVAAFFADDLAKIKAKFDAFELRIKRSGWIAKLLAGGGVMGIVVGFLTGQRRGSQKVKGVLGEAATRLGAVVRGLGGSPDLITGAYKEAGGEKLVMDMKPLYKERKKFFDDLAEALQRQNGSKKPQPESTEKTGAES